MTHSNLPDLTTPSDERDVRSLLPEIQRLLTEEQFTSAFALAERAVEAAEGSEDLTLHEQLLTLLVQSGVVSQHPEQLRTFTSRLIHLAHAQHHARLEAEAYLQRAAACNLLGAFQDAVGDLQHSIHLRAATGDLNGQATCLNNLGLLHAHLGEHSEALNCLFRCHQLSELYPEVSEELQGSSLVNIAQTYVTLRRYDEAEELALRGLDAARRVGSGRTELGAMAALGMARAGQRKFAQARAVLQEALSLATTEGALRDVVDLADNLGQVYAEEGEFELALRSYQHSLDIARELGDVQGLTNAQLHLGKVHARVGAYEESVRVLQEALFLARTHHLRNLELDAQHALFTCHEASGDAVRALEAHKAFHALERELFSDESGRVTRDLTARFEAQQARREAELYRQLTEVSQNARLQAEETVRLRTAELEAAQIEVVTRLGMAAEYRDDRTGQHTLRVGELSARLARAVGLTPEQVDLIRWAARLHDIGKIGVPDDVLLKPGTFSRDEHERMKLHTIIGAKVLEGSTSPLLKLAEEIALTHHERWDGQGYPRGLGGTDIPISGRIVAVADVFDALTSERPYKIAWPLEKALEEMNRLAGTHFDPLVVQCLNALMTGGPGADARVEDGAPAGRDMTGEAGEDRGAEQAIDELLQRSWEMRQESPQEGERLAREALRLARERGYVRGVGYAQRNLGFFDFLASNLNEALRELSQGLEIGQYYEDLQLQFDCVNFAAAVYSALTDNEQAVSHLLIALSISRAMGEELRVGHCLQNLGLVSIDRRDFQEAVAYIEEAGRIYASLSDTRNEAVAHLNLARALYEMGDYEASARSAELAIEKAGVVDSTYLRENARSRLGSAYAKLGRYAEALELQHSALSYALDTENKSVQTWVHCELAGIHLDTGHAAEARVHLHRALELARATGIRKAELQAFELLSRLEEREGNMAAAFEAYRQYHATEKSIFDDESGMKTRALMLQLDVERAKAEAQIYKLQTIELASANEALERVYAEKSSLVNILEEQSKLLERQLSEDGLTGLYNRRHIEGVLQKEFLAQKQAQGMLCIAMVDIDHFKQVNDQFSHLVGDQVLVTVAQLFREMCRPTDSVGRYGGEEFLFVFPGATLEQGRRICERVAQRVAEFDWRQVHPQLRVTLSMGVACDLSLPNHERLVALADMKLYEAKNTGRNCIAS